MVSQGGRLDRLHRGRCHGPPPSARRCQQRGISRMRRIRHPRLRRAQHDPVLEHLLLAHTRLHVPAHPLLHLLLRGRRWHAHGRNQHRRRPQCQEEIANLGCPQVAVCHPGHCCPRLLPHLLLPQRHRHPHPGVPVQRNHLAALHLRDRPHLQHFQHVAGPALPVLPAGTHGTGRPHRP